MATVRCFLLIAMALMAVAAAREVQDRYPWSEDEEDWNEMINILSKPRVLDRYRDDQGQPKHSMGVSQVTGFNWKNCGDPSYPSTISQISVSPDPMKLPGNISLAFSGSLKVPLKAPLTLDLEVEKKVLFWITVPCIDHFGSCNYEDVCQYFPLIHCPPIFQKYGIPCECPIAAKAYTLPESPFYIDDSAVPSLLADGDYRVTARLSQGKQDIVCVYLEFSIQKSVTS